MNEVTAHWEEILSTLKREYQITDLLFNTWLKNLTVYEETKDRVTILVPKDFSTMGVEIIEGRYKTQIQVTISYVTGLEKEISFISEENIPSRDPVKEESKENSHISYEDSLINPRYTFDTFVVGSNNKLAHAAALAISDEPGKRYNPLFIYAGAGLGKTHLMNAIANYIIENHPEQRVLYTTSEQFTNDLISAIRNGNNSALSRFREKYRNIDILLVDDIQFIIGKESTQEEFFHTFNSLHSAKKQIVISSDKPPKEMAILEERFRSRFEWGLLADINPPDYETRVAILQKKAELDGIHLDDEIYHYLASNIRSNIRELEGALNIIIAKSKLEHVDITTDLVQNALKDIISNKDKYIPTPEEIIKTVADYYQTTPEEIKGDRRYDRLNSARQISMYLIREIIGAHYQEIGAIFNRKHSTIMNGVNNITRKYETSEDTKTVINMFMKKLTS